MVAGLYANLCFAAYGRRKKPSMLFGRGKISLSRLHSISIEPLASYFWNHSKHVISDSPSVFTCMFTFIASEELSISTIAINTHLRHMCAIPLCR